jgi:hypothetical protein
MRILGIIVIILGLVALVFGILFLPQASSAEQLVADSIAPNLTLDKVDATYDALTAQFKALKGTEPQYLQVLAQRTSVGLAKSNIGLASLIRMLGIVNIVIGLGLAATGVVLVRKA